MNIIWWLNLRWYLLRTRRVRATLESRDDRRYFEYLKDGGPYVRKEDQV
jgi:hypothetical protein